MTTPGSLAGATALVTGSSRGIGRGVAIALAAAGARVAIHGRSAEAAAEVAGLLAPQDRHAGTFLADLAEADGAERLLGQIEAAGLAPDIFVALAGADVLTGEAAGWSFSRKLQTLLAVDVTATIRLAREIGRKMQARGAGSIVTVGWDQAEIGMEGDSGQLFAATKAAVMAFSRSLARSLGPQVRVNCVAPGWIRTAWGEQASETWQQRARREAVLGRWGEVTDVAEAVAWLVSPEASWVSGQVLAVNGGFRRGGISSGRAFSADDKVKH